ncbi:MAG: ATP synthase F1 subunit delta [Planctomycetes bacterium]|jgi:F-type H+-transporting ATPase subunit delta|nr:ATP synthase F1 subunit delta [Phycisphaerae bacterium]NBB95133.1 ATP synthase F1 subunit delta [Planctomycetota bacterium]
MSTADASLPTVLEPEHRTLGRVYAEALADVTARGELDAGEVADELDGLVATLRDVEGAVDMLSSPHLRAAERVETVDRIVRGRVSEPVAGLLGVLARNGRLVLLAAVAEAFGQVLDERAGRVEVLVTTAVSMDEATRQAVTRQVTDMIGREPVLRCIVDANIVGGLVLQIGDRVYDASVTGDLKRMSRSVARSLAAARLRRDETARDANAPEEKPDDKDTEAENASPLGGGGEASSRRGRQGPED